MRQVVRQQELKREPPDSFSRLDPRSEASMIIACLLLIQAAVFLWGLAIPSPMIDFFTFWSVPHVLATKPVANIYSPENQRDMASEMFAEAQSHGVSEVQQGATAAIAQLYGGRLDVTGSPLLYTAIGLFSSGDYEADRRQFLWFSVFCLAASVVALCRLLGFSAVSTVLLLVFFGTDYSPVLADLRVGNVNEIQLLMITLFILFTVRSWPLCAGITIGIATMFKPTTLVILGLSVLLGLADRQYRRILRMLLGCLAAAVVSIAASELYFRDPAVWTNFIGSLPHTLGGGSYPLERGNFGLSALLFGGAGQYGGAIFLFLFFTCLLFVFATRGKASPGKEPASDDDNQRLLLSAFSAAGVGTALMLLSSPLAWLHYYILLVPLSLFLIRPHQNADKITLGMAFVPLLMFSATTESMMRGNALGESIMVNGATALTLGLAVIQMWRDRRTAGATALCVSP